MTDAGWGPDAETSTTGDLERPVPEGPDRVEADTSSPWAPDDDAPGVPSPLFDGPPVAPRARSVELSEPAVDRWFPDADTDADPSSTDLPDETDRPALDAEPDDLEVHPGPRRRRVGVAAGVLAFLAVVAVVGGSTILRDGADEVAGARLPRALDERWRTAVDDGLVVDGVVTSDAVVVVVDRSGPGGTEVIGFDAVDGAERWRTPVDSVSTGLHVVDDDLVVVSATREFAEGRYAFAVEPRTGERIWDRVGDGVVFSTEATGVVAVVDSGRFPAPGPTLEFADLRTGETLPPVGGRLAGLRADGDVIAVGDDGSVVSVDVSGHSPGDRELASSVVATTSPEVRGVVELAGRWFAAVDTGLVEIGFTADSPRVVLDRRAGDDVSSPMPSIGSSSFFASVDDRHAVVLGPEGVMGIELVDDELRVRWSAGAAAGLPRRVDGGRTVVEVWDDRVATDDTVAARTVDAVTGEALHDGHRTIPTLIGEQPVDGTLSWTPGPSGPGAAVAVTATGLAGDERWSIVDVVAGPFVGDGTAVVAVVGADASEADGAIVFYDEGPRNRP